MLSQKKGRKKEGIPCCVTPRKRFIYEIGSIIYNEIGLLYSPDCKMFASVRIYFVHSAFCIVRDTKNTTPLKLVHYYKLDRCIHSLFLFLSLSLLTSFLKHDPWCLLLNNGNHHRILFALFPANRLQWHFSVISHFWHTNTQKRRLENDYDKKEIWTMYVQCAAASRWRKTESRSVLYIGHREAMNNEQIRCWM